MRVALISTPWKKVPPDGYGGTENVVANILAGANELNLDINFNLFTVGQSLETPQIQNLNGRIKTGWIFEKEYYAEIGNANNRTWVETLHAMHAWNMVAESGADIIHDHSGIVFSTIARTANRRVPILITLHGALNTPLIQDFYRLLAKSPYIYFNSISNAQRKALPDLPYIGTVHNGIKVEDFPFRKDKENYLLILGRITPVKGQKEAIEIAKSLDIPLVIAGSVEDTSEAKEYWQTIIEPRIEADLSRSAHKMLQLRSLFKIGNLPKVIYFGEADSENKKWLYATAKAFLMPIFWEEPFGLVMIEAMASGTPVVALRRGAAPEIVEHGRTGFLANNIKEMIAALKQIHSISPNECRERVVKHFSSTKMAEGYSKLYARILFG